MTLPLLLLAALMLLHIAALGADQVALQSLAAQTARSAAVDGAEAASAAVRAVWPDARVRVERARPAGAAADWWRVELTVPARQFRWAGVERQLWAQAWARTQ